MKRPLFEINIDKAAVVAATLALILLMHIMIGWRFANLNNRLETYNKQITDQVNINYGLLARLQDQYKLIDLDARVDMDQTVSITKTWDMLTELRKELENVKANSARHSAKNP